MKQKAKKSWTMRVNSRKPFIDPRLPIARQIGWVRPAGDVTTFSVPEPDNFNRAVFTAKPVECKFVREQVIYYDHVRRGWFNVAYLEPEQHSEYALWLDTLPWLASWQHDEPHVLRDRAAE